MSGPLRKWSARTLLLALTLAASACATVGPSASACGWVKPVYVHPDDVLTDRTVEQILNHNEKWSEICGQG